MKSDSSDVLDHEELENNLLEDVEENAFSIAKIIIFSILLLLIISLVSLQSYQSPNYQFCDIFSVCVACYRV